MSHSDPWKRCWITHMTYLSIFGIVFNENKPIIAKDPLKVSFSDWAIHSVITSMFNKHILTTPNHVRCGYKAFDTRILLNLPLPYTLYNHSASPFHWSNQYPNWDSGVRNHREQKCSSCLLAGSNISVRCTPRANIYVTLGTQFPFYIERSWNVDNSLFAVGLSSWFGISQCSLNIVLLSRRLYNIHTHLVHWMFLSSILNWRFHMTGALYRSRGVDSFGSSHNWHLGRGSCSPLSSLFFTPMSLRFVVYDLCTSYYVSCIFLNVFSFSAWPCSLSFILFMWA